MPFWVDGQNFFTLPKTMLMLLFQHTILVHLLPSGSRPNCGWSKAQHNATKLSSSSACNSEHNQSPTWLARSAWWGSQEPFTPATNRPTQLVWTRLHVFDTSVGPLPSGQRDNAFPEPARRIHCAGSTSELWPVVWNARIMTFRKNSAISWMKIQNQFLSDFWSEKVWRKLFLQGVWSQSKINVVET